jgi:hypothetical protein
MTTTRAQVLQALESNNEDVSAVVCFYRPYHRHVVDYERDDWSDDCGSSCPSIIQCSVDELPEREYYDGYGRVEGENVFCFSARYVYFRHGYDGSERIVFVPRNPDTVDDVWAITRG